MNSKPNINVFIVDDNNLAKEQLARDLEKLSFIRVIGTANSGDEFLRIFKTKPLSFDILIMDILMPGMDGIETAHQFKQLVERQRNKISDPSLKPHIPDIIFLSVFGGPIYKRHAFELEASFIGKNVSISYLISTIERVYMGEMIINPNPDPPIPVHIDETKAKLKLTLKTLLNEEQIDIACQVRLGYTADQISLVLGTNSHHINNQKRQIYTKLKELFPNINAALLGALMERSGLCEPLDLSNLDVYLNDKIS